MGPVEVLVIAFPGSRFNGRILPALTDVVERGVITVIDGVLVERAEDGDLSVIEIEEVTSDSELSALTELIHEVRDIISDDDVEQLCRRRSSRDPRRPSWPSSTPGPSPCARPSPTPTASC